jgi:hypothetical protein
LYLATWKSRKAEKKPRKRRGRKTLSSSIVFIQFICLSMPRRSSQPDPAFLPLLFLYVESKISDFCIWQLGNQEKQKRSQKYCTYRKRRGRKTLSSSIVFIQFICLSMPRRSSQPDAWRRDRSAFDLTRLTPGPAADSLAEARRFDAIGYGQQEQILRAGRLR